MVDWVDLENLFIKKNFLTVPREPICEFLQCVS